MGLDGAESGAGAGGDAAARHRASRALFERASAVEGAARRAVLDEARAGDATLADEVEGMLKFFDQTSAALDAPPMALLGVEAPASAAGSADGAEHERLHGVLPTGTVLDGWVLDRVLAQGGTSVVYAASRAAGLTPAEALGEPMRAVRVIRGELVSAAMLERFASHGPRLMAVQHEGLARTLAVGVAEVGGSPRPYVAQELVAGEALLEACAGLPPRRRVAVMIEAAEALHAAHAQGVVDGELTPERMRVGPDGRARVIGLGVDRLLVHEPASRMRGVTAGLAGTGTRMASVYAAPERGGREGGNGDSIDPRADVYALGVMMSEALTGRSVRAGAAEWLESGVPKELAAIVRCASAREESARYATAGELAADLRGWLSTPPPRRKMSQRRRFWLVLVLAIAGTLVGAGVKWLVGG